MPPKKPTQEPVEEPKTFTPASPPPAPRGEKLLKFRAIVSFSDGNLREFMENYGYECEWRMNEVRALPAWLIRRCIQSGAELDRADLSAFAQADDG